MGKNMFRLGQTIAGASPKYLMQDPNVRRYEMAISGMDAQRKAALEEAKVATRC